MPIEIKLSIIPFIVILIIISRICIYGTDFYTEYMNKLYIPNNKKADNIELITNAIIIILLIIEIYLLYTL